MFSMMLFMQIVGLYAFARGIYLYPTHYSIKIALGIIIELGTLNLTIMLFFCRYFPIWLNILFGFSGISMIYLANSTAIMEIFRLCKFNNEKIYYCLVVLSLILAFIGVYRSISEPVVKNIEIPAKNITKEYRIAQLSDMHTGPVLKKEWVQRVVKKVNELKPDITVITGDSMDSSLEDGYENLEPLKDINSKIYMIMGNHEYFYNAPEWIKAFQKIGIKVLINSHEIINNDFALGGADWNRGYNKNSERNISKTFANVPENMPKILLSHYPKSFTEAKEENVLLQLSGHTHGGQTFPVNLFVSMANGNYLRGLYKETNPKGETSYLYVNDGTGLWAGMPARLGSSNEITLIKLIKENNK